MRLSLAADYTWRWPGESLSVFCENQLEHLLVVVVCKSPATMRRVWWLWFEIAIVLSDLIVELLADVALARLKGQSDYLYPLTCNLSLTGLTKPPASSCCATKTHWKFEPLEIPAFAKLRTYRLMLIEMYRRNVTNHISNQPENVPPYFCVRVCFTDWLKRGRRDQPVRFFFSSSLSLLHLWLPISSH